MDLETVRLIEKYESWFRSIALAVKFSKNNPEAHKFNPEALMDLCRENSELGINWLAKHAEYKLDHSENLCHYFPKEPEYKRVYCGYCEKKFTPGKGYVNGDDCPDCRSEMEKRARAFEGSGAGSC